MYFFKKSKTSKTTFIFHCLRLVEAKRPKTTPYTGKWVFRIFNILKNKNRRCTICVFTDGSILVFIGSVSTSIHERRRVAKSAVVELIEGCPRRPG